MRLSQVVATSGQRGQVHGRRAGRSRCVARDADQRRGRAQRAATPASGSTPTCSSSSSGPSGAGNAASGREGAWGWAWPSCARSPSPTGAASRLRARDPARGRSSASGSPCWRAPPAEGAQGRPTVPRDDLRSPDASWSWRTTRLVRDAPTAAGAGGPRRPDGGGRKLGPGTGAPLPPEVVLCDIGLPGQMDGLALGAALRRDPSYGSPAPRRPHRLWPGGGPRADAGRRVRTAPHQAGDARRASPVARHAADAPIARSGAVAMAALAPAGRSLDALRGARRRTVATAFALDPLGGAPAARMVTVHGVPPHNSDDGLRTFFPWISPRQPPVARPRSSMNFLKRSRSPSTRRLTNPSASPTFSLAPSGS